MELGRFIQPVEYPWEIFVVLIPDASLPYKASYMANGTVWFGFGDSLWEAVGHSLAQDDAERSMWMWETDYDAWLDKGDDYDA